MDHEKATVQELRWRIAQLEKRLDNQERVNREILNSTIWRATAPLRSLMTPFSQLVRRLKVRSGAQMSEFAPPFVRTLDHSGPLITQPFDHEKSGRFCLLDIIWPTTATMGPLQSQPSLAQNALGLVQVNVFEDGALSSTPIVKLDFSAHGNAALYTVYGFSGPEPWGVWTEGQKSRIVFWLPKSSPDQLQLELSGGTRNKAVDAIAPQIAINQVLLGPANFSSDGKASFVWSAQQATAIPNSAHNVSHDEAAKPVVSVLILNFNKPYLTFLSVIALINAKTNLDYEIIVLDNGSSGENGAILAGMDLPVRLIRLSENRFFGEGNNIVAEMARGETLLFLNNDAFVEDFVLDKLKDALSSSPTIGAAGPIFYYPDGTLQEAGAYIAKDGSAYQRGKGTRDLDVSQWPKLSEVDYVSAACLMIGRQNFLELGGFDLRFDPAYYEDSDLCLRLLAKGQATVLVRDCGVTHIENATTAAKENKGLADNLTERHRSIFLMRWRNWLNSRNPADFPKIGSFQVAAAHADVGDQGQTSPINAVFTPFPLYPGGGERYLLSAALAMDTAGNRERAAVVTVTPYSRCRLNGMCRELGLDENRLVPLALQQAASRPIHRYVHMGNEIIPSGPNLGSHGVFHCQFPFPDSLPVALDIGLDYLASYQVVVVNSVFTRDAYLRALAKVSGLTMEVRVIHPPVRMVPPSVIGVTDVKEKMILSIGRFSPDGHAKRQDLIIRAFKKLVGAQQIADWRLVLCGTVPRDRRSTDYFEQCQREATGFDIDFVLAPDREQLENLYRRAGIYVSATGAGIINPNDFHKCEHFGITVVEAMSAGCVVLVADKGGPAEIVARTGTGFLFKNPDDLEIKLLQAIHASEQRIVRVSQDTLDELYSWETFKRNWSELWDDLEAHR